MRKKSLTKFNILTILKYTIQWLLVYSRSVPSTLSESGTSAPPPLQPEGALTVSGHSLLPSHQPGSHRFALSLWTRPLGTPRVTGSTQALSFCIWLLPRRVTPSRLIHAGACAVLHFFSWLSDILWQGRTTFCSPITCCGHRGCFHLLAVRNHSLWTFLYKFFVWIYVFLPCGIPIGVDTLLHTSERFHFCF